MLLLLYVIHQTKTTFANSIFGFLVLIGSLSLMICFSHYNVNFRSGDYLSTMLNIRISYRIIRSRRSYKAMYFLESLVYCIV